MTPIIMRDTQSISGWQQVLKSQCLRKHNLSSKEITNDYHYSTNLIQIRLADDVCYKHPLSSSITMTSNSLARWAHELVQEPNAISTLARPITQSDEPVS